MSYPVQASPGKCARFLRWYCSFVSVASAGQSVFLLLIRLYIGYQCAKAGYNHITHFQETVEAFRGWNIPMPKVNAVIAATTEMVGGTLLFLGLGARLIAVPLTVNFIVAFLAVNLSDEHYRQLLHNFWDNQDVLLKDTAFPFLVTSIIVLLFGPGLFSIDAIIRRNCCPT